MSNTIKAEAAPAQVGSTPGPWHVDTSNGEFRMVAENGQSVFLIGDERRLIPMLEDRMLIASAPVLLAALKESLRWLDKAQSDGAFCGCVSPDGGRKAIERSIAAIVLAEVGDK